MKTSFSGKGHGGFITIDELVKTEAWRWERPTSVADCPGRLRSPEMKPINPMVRIERLAVCIGCSCDDLHACMHSIEPCHWLRVDRNTGRGVCSVCPELVVNWDAGEMGER